MQIQTNEIATLIGNQILISSTKHYDEGIPLFESD